MIASLLVPTGDSWDRNIHFFRLKFIFFWSKMTKVQYPVVLIFPDFWQTADLDGCTGSVCGLLSLFFSLSLENVFKQRKKCSSKKVLRINYFLWSDNTRFWHKWKEVKQEMGSWALNAGYARHLSLFIEYYCKFNFEKTKSYLFRGLCRALNSRIFFARNIFWKKFGVQACQIKWQATHKLKFFYQNFYRGRNWQPDWPVCFGSASFGEPD